MKGELDLGDQRMFSRERELGKGRNAEKQYMKIPTGKEIQLNQ